MNIQSGKTNTLIIIDYILLWYNNANIAIKNKNDGIISRVRELMEGSVMATSAWVAIVMQMLWSTRQSLSVYYNTHESNALMNMRTQSCFKSHYKAAIVHKTKD